MGSPALPTVIVLAAGRGERFLASGGQVHKLQAMLGSKPVLQHTLDAVRASGLPLHLVAADASRPGMGDSIAAGVRATPSARGWLVLPGDLPLIQPQTLCQIAAALADLPAGVQAVVPVVHGQRGHPVGFVAALGPALMALHGPQGAAALLQQAAVVELALQDEGCITDIDTLADLRQAEQRLRALQHASKA